MRRAARPDPEAGRARRSCWNWRW